MADLLVSSAPAEPVRICPACGDVLVSGVCASCAPPPARAYHERATLPALGKGLVDSRRAAAEWSVSPEDLDPHTRKAHPSQLRSAPREYDLPEPAPRGKRQTQVYKKGGGPLPGRPTPAPAAARAWTLPEPLAAPTSDEPQASSTARHARPVSPLRPASGPVSMPGVLAPRPEPTREAEPAPPPDRPSGRPAPEPEAIAAESFDRSGEVGAAELPRHRPDPDLELDLAALRPRRHIPPIALLVLGAGALIGVLAALL